MRYIFIFGAALLLAGCYSERKAKGQFGKAVTAYPEIAADYCGITFPVKEVTTPGKPVIIRDTLPGAIHFDTLRSLDTVYITKYIQGATIRETITRTDTITIENKAALEATRLQLAEALRLANDNAALWKKWEDRAKTRFWIIIALGALLGASAVWIVKRK